MCIVYDGCKSIRSIDSFQTSTHGFHATHGNQNLLGGFAQHDSGSIDSKKVVDIEFANELHSYFTSVDFQIHPLEVTFDDLCLEICRLLHGICLDGCMCILHHHHSVLIVDIGNCKCIGWQLIEEQFLCTDIVLERLMVVQMVASDIGKHATCKCQTANTVLDDGVRTDFHEYIFASGFCHLSQQTVQCNRVGSGMLSWDGFTIDIIHNGR